MGIEELIMLAVKNGVDTISVTDHDCMAGNVRAKIIGERNNIRVIPGVELSATDKETGKSAHILAYLCDSPDRIEGLCHSNAIVRKRAGQYMMLKAVGRYPLSVELVQKCATGSMNLYKHHIMHALMECGFTNTIYGELYDDLFSSLSDNNILITPAYAPVEEVIKAVQDAGGIAVLAHTAIADNPGILERLIPLGLDGIEVWSPHLLKEAEERLISIAKKNKLLITGGSDFHGMYNKTRLTVGQYSTPEQYLDELFAYKSKKKKQQKKASVVNG